MIALVPIPYANKLFRGEIKEKQTERVSNNNQSVSVHQNYQNEQTQEQNILSPNNIIRRESDEEINTKI